MIPGDWRYSRSMRTQVLVVRLDEAFGVAAVQVWHPGSSVLAVVPAADLGKVPREGRADAAIAAAAAARIVEALTTGTLVAPTQSIVEPLPHQLRALSRCVAASPIRMLLADEVGLGKTIEAGLVITELALRGLARRILVVAPAGLVPQWQTELSRRFGEDFVAISSGEVGALASRREDNFWRAYDRLIVPLDAVKPVEARRGWTDEEVERHNVARSTNLAAAGWDVVVIDEAHRVAGSDERVARHRLARLLAEATPNLLLLSATPHAGKTDGFRRVLALLDRRPFAGDVAITPERVAPYVVRTSKRVAIDAAGLQLFQPRTTTKIVLDWPGQRPHQRRLYDEVTAYVREGYDFGRREKNNSLVFLMLLMQRLVSSSTRAIETALGRRLATLVELEARATPRPPELRLDDDFWEEDAEDQAEQALQTAVPGVAAERATVERLLALAQEARAEGLDAKLERLYELIVSLTQEENDPLAKVLVFTEFVPTQALIADFLGAMGVAVAVLNGSLSVEDRLRAQDAFAGPAQVLVSTEAGGEGLNLQVAHLVVNYDLPWNPMRIEQRIGRVDRIGQTRPVRAFNLVLRDSVEDRVHDLLETKLARVLAEFGVDKLSDVLDSSAFESAFQAAYGDAVRGLDPDQITSTLVAEVEQAGAVLRDWRDLLGGEMPDPAEARAMREHPLPLWVERLTVAGVLAGGGSVERLTDGWRLRWAEGPDEEVAFRRDQATSDRRLLTLGDPRVAGLLAAAISGEVTGAVPRMEIRGADVLQSGVWSLWIVGAHLGPRHRRRAVPVFLDAHGAMLPTTARAIWERLMEPAVELRFAGDGGEIGDADLAASRVEAERIAAGAYASLRDELTEQVRAERARYLDYVERRRQLIERIGLDNVRRRRLAELAAEQARELNRLPALDVAPELRCVAAFEVVA